MKFTKIKDAEQRMEGALDPTSSDDDVLASMNARFNFDQPIEDAVIVIDDSPPSVAHEEDQPLFSFLNEEPARSEESSSDPVAIDSGADSSSAFVPLVESKKPGLREKLAGLLRRDNPSKERAVERKEPSDQDLKGAQAPTQVRPSRAASLMASAKARVHARKSQTPASRGKSSYAPTLVVELDTGQQLAWHVTEDGLESAPVEEVGVAVLASRSEQRYRTEGALSLTAAQNLALAELAEEVRVLNRSREQRVIYAMTTQNVDDLNFIAKSAFHALDLLAKGDVELPAEGPAVLGFLLSGRDGVSVVVLYYRNEAGDYKAPLVSLNPDDLNFVLQQLYSTLRVSAGVPVVLYDNADFLRVYENVGSYPAENALMGVPLSSVVRGLSLASTVAGVVSIAAAGYLYTEQQVLQSRMQAAQAQIEQTQARINTVISSGLPSFARVLSLDTEQLIDRALQLYLPSSRIVLSATPEASSYRMVLPLTSNARFLNRPSVARARETSDVQRLLDVQAPEGCERSTPAINNALNEVELTITCQGADSSLNRYRSS